MCRDPMRLDCSLLVSLSLQTVDFTSGSLIFSPTLGGDAGWPEGTGVGYFPSPRSLRF